MKNLFRVLLSLAVLVTVPLTLLFADLRISDLESQPPRTYEASVAPKPLKVFCPGGTVRTGGANGTEPGVFEVISDATIGLNAPAGTVEGDASQISVGQSFTSLDQSEEQSTEVLSATQISVAKDSRIAGLAAINCSQPVSSGYFVNGKTTVGTESILIFSNPGDVESIVDIQLVLDSENRAQVVLPPGSQKYFNLSQIAPDSEAFLIHFQATGSGVSAALQQRTIDGLNPTGLDLSDSSGQPDVRHIYPAIASVGTLITPEPQLAQSLLRVANPATVSTEVRVLLTSTSESKTVVFDIEPQSIFEKNLELTEGIWSALVESDIPVFTAIKNSTFAQAIDFEWLLPVQELQGKLVLQVRSAFSLQLFNAGDSSLDYTVNGQPIRLAAKERLTIPISTGFVELRGSKIWAVASLLGQNGFGVIEPKENRNLGSNLQVTFQ